MVDSATIRTWLYRLTYLAACGSVIFFYLIPLRFLPGNWPAPDLLAGLTYAWVLRRPEYVPVWLIGGVMFLADMLFLRPPGLEAAVVVMASEFLRRRRQILRELPFWVEWALVAGSMIGVFLLQRMIMMIVLLERPPLVLALLQLLTSIFVYPLVVFATRHIFGVHKSAPGEVDALGHRI